MLVSPSVQTDVSNLKIAMSDSRSSGGHLQVSIISGTLPIQNAPTKEKFQNPNLTAKGEQRAQIDLKKLETLWFNTGTLCNLTCENCYIESSPKNDRLVYISLKEVKTYLEEIQRDGLGTQEIGLTGGEPFMNPEIIEIISESLSRGFGMLVLTNAMRPMQKCSDQLLKLKETYGNKLKLRVSIDHYTQALHEEERGASSWKPTVEGLQWLSSNGFNIDVAGRTRWGDDGKQLREGYKEFFVENNIDIEATNPEELIIFPEMDEKAEVPEITTKCWDILEVDPDDIMCATSRMVVKHKGANTPTIAACTLLPYDAQFQMGKTLKDSFASVKLNHPHCAKFCVLGGGSCRVDS